AARGEPFALALIHLHGDAAATVEALRDLHRDLPMVLIPPAGEAPPPPLPRGVIVLRPPVQDEVLGALAASLLERHACQQERERWRRTLEAVSDGVMHLDGSGSVVYLNPVAEGITGWTGSEARGQPLERVCQLLDAATRKTAFQPLAGTAAADLPPAPTLLVDRYGQESVVDFSAIPLAGGSGFVLVLQDVTQTRRLTELLSFQATHDSLTGLLNRHEFERRLEWLMAMAREDGTEHTLCYLDLDQFKVVNDTCGHAAGDELLRQITRLIKPHIREADTLARLGGDEFGLLLEGCPLDRALTVAGMLCETISDLRYVWEDKVFNVSVSIGLAAVNQNSEVLERVLSAADAACFAAKEEGRNRVRVYQDDDADLARRRGEMQLVSDLTQAFEENRFCLYFQEIAPLTPAAGRGCHGEILVRMRDAAGGLVPPGAFLAAAERYNLILRLDRWVVRNTLRWFAGHPQQLARLDICTINLSGQAFGDAPFLEFVADQFRQSAVPPAKFCFEITETAAVANFSKAQRFIQRLQEIGCCFALDDFGTGMSSFAYLKNLPANFLKIDGAFVRGVVEDAIDLALVKSINDIGHVMGMKTIAEFVENDAILEKLRAVGVDYAQGYGIARPRPLEEMG
ncbi:MAG: EAL domain-containing protein, partial [Pseudomonadota bacterium]|nr:EAL domain-containing protein [Pseudomonadota bacterium]